jgi:hypothetical protein
MDYNYNHYYSYVNGKWCLPSGWPWPIMAGSLGNLPPIGGQKEPLLATVEKNNIDAVKPYPRAAG